MFPCLGEPSHTIRNAFGRICRINDTFRCRDGRSAFACERLCSARISSRSFHRCPRQRAAPTAIALDLAHCRVKPGLRANRPLHPKFLRFRTRALGSSPLRPVLTLSRGSFDGVAKGLGVSRRLNPLRRLTRMRRRYWPRHPDVQLASDISRFRSSHLRDARHLRRPHRFGSTQAG